MTVKPTPLRRKTKPRNLRSYGTSRRSSTKIASASPNSSEPSSRTNHTYMAEVHAVGLEKRTDRSSETRCQTRSSAVSLEQARMSWQ